MKAYVCRAAEWVTREALQIHGGMGYAEEFPVSRYFVDARVLSIFEGADEMLALRSSPADSSKRRPAGLRFARATERAAMSDSVQALLRPRPPRREQPACRSQAPSEPRGNPRTRGHARGNAADGSRRRAATRGVPHERQPGRRRATTLWPWMSTNIGRVIGTTPLARPAGLLGDSAIAAVGSWMCVSASVHTATSKAPVTRPAASCRSGVPNIARRHLAAREVRASLRSGRCR